MSIIKSPAEVSIIRRAGTIVSRVHEAVCRYIQPGTTTLALDAIISSQIHTSGAVPSYKGYLGYPFVSYIDVNEHVVHSLPTNQRLKQGDIATVSFGIIFDGFHVFQSITYPVGILSPENVALLYAANSALEKAVECSRPGMAIGDISSVIQLTSESAVFSVCREYTGCGVGRSMHEEPPIPNFGASGVGPRLRAGMTLFINPILMAGDWRTEIASDGWTVVTADRKNAASFSHVIAITESDPEILTPYKMDWIRR